jgi:pyridoxal phosphate enzyme (YggS family)
MMMMEIQQRLERVRADLQEAVRRSGRREDEVQLMAVSKFFPAQAVLEAVGVGQRVFGENRVLEAVEKAALCGGDLEWHLIGHLQRNKIRKLLPSIQRVDSVDSLELARQLDRVAGELGLRVRGYLEVNVGGEDSKSGFEPEALRAALDELLALPHLVWDGLMSIPPFHEDTELVRPYFVALRELRDELEQRGGLRLPGLSMGMSHDFTVAVEEGSTLVRVGTAIFGGRQTQLV